MSSEYLLKVVIVGEPLDLIAQMVYLKKNPKIPLTRVDVHTSDIKIGESSIKLVLVFQAEPRISDEIIAKYYKNKEEYQKDLRAYHGDKSEHLPSSMYGGASLFIITFDKSNQDSFQKVKDWNDNIRTFLPSDDVPITLIGFVTDCVKITTEVGHDLADQLSMDYFETKPTDEEKVVEIYSYQAQKLLEKTT